MNDKDFEKLAFGMAHQIRNPCAIIRSNANLLLQNGKVDEKTRTSLQAIIKGTLYLEERLDEFIEFSKPLNLKLKQVSLENVFQEILVIVKEKNLAKKAVISRNDMKDLFLSKADHDQILLALLSIVVNSMEAVKDRGSIHLNAKKSGNWIEIEIHDDGCGIHPRDLPEVFSPFYSTKAGGIGIGLAVAKRIVDAHGGNIEVFSRQGVGTTVKVKLPYA